MLYLEWTGYLQNLLVQSKATDLTSCICQWSIPDTGLSVVIVWLVIQNAPYYLGENFTFSELVLFLYSWKHYKVSTFINKFTQKLQAAWRQPCPKKYIKTQCIYHVLTTYKSFLSAVNQSSPVVLCSSNLLRPSVVVPFPPSPWATLWSPQEFSLDIDLG